MEAAPALAIGGLQGGMGFIGARQQNAAIEQSMQSVKAAGEAAQGQAAAQAGLETMKRSRLAHQVEGRIRAALGESGGPTAAAVERQNAIDADLDQRIILTNFANNIRSIRSGVNARMIELHSQFDNPILAAFAGTMQGVSQGLAIQQGIKGLLGEEDE